MIAIATKNSIPVLINHNGLEVIPPIFDKISRIGFNSFKVEKNNFVVPNSARVVENIEQADKFQGVHTFSFDKYGNCTSSNRKTYYQLISKN